MASKQGHVYGHALTGCAIVVPKTSFKTSREEQGRSCIGNCIFKSKVKFLKGSSPSFMETRARVELGTI